jgi:hypothetical protein
LYDQEKEEEGYDHFNERLFEGKYKDLFNEEREEDFQYEDKEDKVLGNSIVDNMKEKMVCFSSS